MDHLSRQIKKIANDLEAMMQDKELKRMDAFGDAPKDDVEDAYYDQAYPEHLADEIKFIFKSNDAKQVAKMVFENLKYLHADDRKRALDRVHDLHTKAEHKAADDYYAYQDELMDHPGYFERQAIKAFESDDYLDSPESFEYESAEEPVANEKIQALIDSGVVKFDGRNYILEAGDKEALKKLLDAMTGHDD